MSNILYEDIFNIIYELTPHTNRINLALTSKFFNDLYINDITKLMTIQRFYRKYKIDDYYIRDAGLEKYKNNYTIPNYDDWNKKLLYRYYIAKYDDIYLKRYPEFLTGKAIMNSSKKNSAFEWITNNLNEDPEFRTRKDIYNFFVENDISSEEIFIAGW
jgi:hypothetical protein